MAIKKILRMGHPLLRQESSLLEEQEITAEETRLLVQDMLETMRAYEGIGLAAPQIGVSKQLAIIGIPKDSQRYPDAHETSLIVVINPVITVLNENKQSFWEGCLSVPGLRGLVSRPSKIRVDFRTLEGNKESLELEGFLATVFQHEIDHLFGKLYIDRLNDTTQLSFDEEFQQFWAQPHEEKDL